MAKLSRNSEFFGGDIGVVHTDVSTSGHDSLKAFNVVYIIWFITHVSDEFIIFILCLSNKIHYSNKKSCDCVKKIHALLLRKIFY